MSNDHPEITQDSESAIGATEIAEALDPNVGDGTPETAPHVLPGSSSLLDREPWLVALAVVELPIIGEAVQAALDGEPVRAVVSAAIGATVTAVVAFLRGKTTPVADPKISDDVRLTPDVG